ncbi:MAG: chemotaxis protein CheW [Opitutales bacterium]|jgi:chemotaxis-related protein WspD
MPAATTPSPLQTGQPADRCWARIGVWGNGSCSELTAYVHCCNCPVYSASGRSLLERPPPENYAREWEASLRVTEERQGRASSVLLFRLGPEWLALPASVVGYVTEKRSVHRLPQRSSRVLSGIVNIQGELHLAFNLHALLELPDEVPEGIALSRRVYPRVLLCRREQQAFAFPVDEVFGIAPLETGQLQAAPATASKALATYTRGLFAFRDRAVGLIDEDLLFHSLTRQHLNI